MFKLTPSKEWLEEMAKAEEGHDLTTGNPYTVLKREPSKIYAGIGSRKIFPDAVREIKEMSKKLDELGYTLRSGGAIGADTAFEEMSTKKQIFKANDATPKAIELASKLHPAWHQCNDYARKLHGRNVMIILGPDLNSFVDFVVCWTMDELNGGTSMGLRLASFRGIPHFNLFRPDQINAFATAFLTV